MKHECWRCGSDVVQETYEKYGYLCEECYKRLNGTYHYELKEMLEENPSGDEAQFLEMLCDFVVLKCEEYDEEQKSN